MEKKIGHTPGPWAVTDDTYRTIKANGTPIAILTMRYYDKLYLENAEANARLIAAAPELLETVYAVERLLAGCLCDDGSWRDAPAANKRLVLDAARAVIAKTQA